MKKKDVILISVIFGIALISFGILKFIQKDGKEVVVTVDGEKVYTASLEKDQVYDIPIRNGKNVMEIKDGKVRMKQADCPDQICKNHTEIEKSGETIVCLPHKIVIEISSEENEQALDGMTR